MTVILWPTFTELYTVIRMLYGTHSSPKPAAYRWTGWYWYARLNQVYNTTGSFDRKSAYHLRYCAPGYIWTQYLGSDYRLPLWNLPFYCLGTTFTQYMFYHKIKPCVVAKKYAVHFMKYENDNIVKTNDLANAI